jgi:NAD(P)-dependent dehydrogenase (short-subunit alcohol dehydrogenase family)/acyl carrier protein
VKLGRASIPLYSTVTGGGAQLALAAASAIRDGHRIFVGLGPSAPLWAEIGGDGEVIAALTGDDERAALLHAVGALYVRGIDVRWGALFPSGGRCLTLPTYAWQRERYWVESAARDEPAGRSAGIDDEVHPLLGRPFTPSLQPGTYYWEQSLSATSFPYLSHHQVQGEIVFPGSGLVEMALAVGTEMYGERRFVLRDVTFESMLAVPASAARRLQVSRVDGSGHNASVAIASRDEASGEWVAHARGTLSEAGEELEQITEPPRFMQARCPTHLAGAEHYARLTARGIHYGPAFQGVEDVWLGADEAVAHVRLPEAAGEAAAYRIHPALLDACLQVSATLMGEGDETLVPVEISQLEVHSWSWREAWVRVAPSAATPGTTPRASLDIVAMDEGGRLLLEVTGLHVQQIADAPAADPFAGCAYGVVWRPKPLAAATSTASPSSARAPGPKTWLVFTDATGTGAAVAEELRARGDVCVEVVSGPRFERSHPRGYVIDPAKPEDYQRLFREVVGADVTFRGVIHCWNLDATQLESTSPETLLADLRRGTVSVLHVVQELVWQSFRDAPRLVLVTRGAQPVGEFASALALAQSVLCGLGRTIAVEQPDLACTRIDLDPAPHPDEAAALVDELLAGDGEDQIAMREGQRLVARLERRDLDTADAPTFSPDVSYLITGGLGGLGLTTARWMVASGARHLLLVGRNDPTDASREAIRAMTEAGAEVRTWRADVARSADVESTMAYLDENMPPLRGIIHAAGVLEDRTLQEMGEEQFTRVIRPKVLGGWNLHLATRRLDLDFFVMYSSAAALLGAPGQGNYAAANTFLDALAHVRAAEGLPAMSIQWGAFSEVGMAAAETNRGQRLAHRGIESFTPAEGMDILSRLIGDPWGEIGVLRMSVRQWVEFYPGAASAPFLSRLRKAEERTLATKSASAFLDALRGMPPMERRPALERHVAECLGRVLGLPPERIEVRAPFRGYGMDSLMSLEIRNRLEASLGLRLSAALLFTYPTTAALVDHLLAELKLEAKEMDESLDGYRSQDGPNANGLSEAAAMAMLDAKISDLESYLK